MEGKNYTGRYCVLHGTYWALYCAAFAMLPVYLRAENCSNFSIGVLSACISLMTILLQPAFAAAADRSATHSIRFFLRICQWGSLGGAFLLLAAYLTERESFFLSFAAFLLACVFTALQMPLLNAVCTYFQRKKAVLNFGISRGTGSFTYAVMIWVLGILVKRKGIGIVPAALFVTLAAFALATCMFRMEPVGAAVPPEKAEKSRTAETAETRSGDFFRRYPGFFPLLAGIFFCFIGYHYINTYQYQIMLNVGGDTADMGFAGAVSAGSELPVMLGFSLFARRFRCSSLLRFGLIMILAKCAAMMISVSPAQVSLAMAFQSIGYAFYIPAGVRFTDEVMEARDLVKGQAAVTSATVMGALAANLSGGWIIDRAGVPLMLKTGVVSSAAGAVISCFAIRMILKNRAAGKNADPC